MGESRAAKIVGWALIAATGVAALLIHSGGFELKSWFGGDIAYHRGVALTMQGASFQGEGPFAGLLSYFGGLYPMLLAHVAQLGGWSVNAVLSVISWPAALLLPAALTYLGWRLWPDRWLTVGIVVVTGTLATGFSSDRGLLWVDSLTLAGHSFWPLYPRDLGLTLLIVAMGTSTAESRRRRVIAIGLLLGLVAMTHAQLGVIGSVFVAICYLAHHRTRQAVVDLAAMAAIAVAVSSWWWVPRLEASLESGRLLLQSHPTRAVAEASYADAVIGIGALGPLGVAGLIVGFFRRRAPWAAGAMLLLCLLVLVVVSELTGEGSVLPARRLVQTASIPLIVLLGVLVECLRERAPPRVAIPVLALIVAGTLGSSIHPTLTTFRMVREAWRPGIGWGQEIDADAWGAAMDQLDPDQLVLTYDAHGINTWSTSGARVHSLWLPGMLKLGFDPERLTGKSYLERNRELTEAFARGREGACELARRIGADAILLDVREGRLGWRDLWVAAPHRVSPENRTSETLEIELGNGLSYRDRNGYDTLVLQPKYTYHSNLVARGGELLALTYREPRKRTNPARLTVSVGGKPAGKLSGAGGYNRLWLEIPKGRTGLVSVRSSRAVALMRLTVFEASPSRPRGESGFAVLDPAQVCPAR